ncbi:LysM peptidoglycan-binding domain-containing protein [Microcella sp.]|uniref:LysM peptidoglycan-binding domain-containing protein n=1 Tax=Microcella sp. TaxID=1913979 RepID=UPI00299F6726|nr:LysM peptidoglycan-binding domain-containing protein [Microcella sp.]MDX2026669.1 LysM peptidoglycan-binding domain-containing protein [Microcella sp.]
MSETEHVVDTAPSAIHRSTGDERARAVFAGLSANSSHSPVTHGRRSAAEVQSDIARRARSSAFTAVPVVLTGAIALGLGLTGPVDPAYARKPVPPKPEQAPPPLGLRTALSQLGTALLPGGLATQAVSTHAAPAVYTVAAGDTVSSIAQRFGLSTASVLALNGLSWKSTIFAGQVLALTNEPVKKTGTPMPTSTAGRYVIEKGDTISGLAAAFGVSAQALLDENGLSHASIIYPGQTIVIPGRVAELQPAPPPVVGRNADVPVLPRGATQTTVTETDTQNTPSLAVAVSALPIMERPVLPSSTHSPRHSSGGTSTSSPTRPPSGGTVTPLTAEMRANASIIVAVGQDLGVPEYGIVIALATAMQESSLRNLSWGDRDSVGLFQQRPSSGWGTAANLQIPSHAAELFYVGRSGYTRGLLDIPGWQNMTLTRAAQAVQISAYPDAYAKWEASAWAWYFDLT